MENKLKSASKGVIEKLESCDVNTIMATGDNILTAISVARQCSLISRETALVLGDIDERT